MQQTHIWTSETI